MASLSKDATPMWDIMSPEDDKAVMEKFTAESNIIINRWSQGDASSTEKDAAVTFLVQLGAVQITIQSGSQQTTQKQVSILFGDGEDLKPVQEQSKDDPGGTKDAFPSEGNLVTAVPDLPDQDAEKKSKVPVWLDQDTMKNGETQMNEDDDEDNNNSVWMTEPDDEDDDDNQLPDPAPVVEEHSTTQPREEHPCPDCHKILHSMWELDLHKLGSCVTKQVYNCDQCSKSFTAKGYAVKHLHRVHNMSRTEAVEKLQDLKSTERQNRRKVVKDKAATSDMPGSKQRGLKRRVGKRHHLDKNVPRQSKQLFVKLKPLPNEWMNILESKTIDVSEISSNFMSNAFNETSAVSNDKMNCKRDPSSPISDSEPVNEEREQGDVNKKTINTMAALESNELEDHGFASEQVHETHKKETKEVNSLYDGDHDNNVTTQKRAKFRKTSRTCKFCDLQFKSVRSRDNHMFIAHSEDVQAYKCNTCNKSFIEKFVFKAHLKTHMDINDREKYQCKMCQKSFLIKFNYQKHMKSHVEKPKAFKCDTCGKVLSCKRGLERHIDSQHKKEIVYTCEECGKNFYTTSYIKQHLEMHAQTRSWKCDECDFTALRKYRIKEHKQQVHINGRFLICEICGAAFNTIVTLKQHLRNVHTNSKFSCDVCGKKFKRACHLRSHVKTHSNDPKDKPFQCEICGKCFRARQRMKEHMNRHNNEGLHTCHHCGKSFKRKGRFDKHQYIHTGKKPHECRICSQGFLVLSGLRKHLDIKHQITLKKRVAEQVRDDRVDKGSTANHLPFHKLDDRPSSPATFISDLGERTVVADVGHQISDDVTELSEASDSKIVQEALLAMMNY